MGSATQPARTWSTKLSDSQMQRFWKDADQVHNQSESFTVSEAGLAGDGPPVVKVILFKQEKLKALRHRRDSDLQKIHKKVV